MAGGQGSACHHAQTGICTSGDARPTRPRHAVTTKLPRTVATAPPLAEAATTASGWGSLDGVLPQDSWAVLPEEGRPGGIQLCTRQQALRELRGRISEDGGFVRRGYGRRRASASPGSPRDCILRAGRQPGPDRPQAFRTCRLPRGLEVGREASVFREPVGATTGGFDETAGLPAEW